MSSDTPPECFFDRSLGRRSAQILRDQGWIIHLIADFYPDDADGVADEVWIAEGCRRGWILLSKDQQIRYRAHELSALGPGHLFCLANGNLSVSDMAQRFLDAQQAMARAVGSSPEGFWVIYEGGRIAKRWP